MRERDGPHDGSVLQVHTENRGVFDDFEGGAERNCERQKKKMPRGGGGGRGKRRDTL